MTTSESMIADDNFDDAADTEIRRCLDLAAPQSFFLFAGAGSGKTKSLVSALQYVRDTFGKELRFRGQRVAVITYTNAASDEIKRRLDHDPIIDVSTIHSFAWSLIDGLNHDIREWLRTELAKNIRETQAAEAKGRKGSTASADRIRRIASQSKRLENLDNIKRFIYSPSSDNQGRDSLSHSEVIKLTSSFLRTKLAMQSILVGRYPILLIDESQDTNDYLIDALFIVQEQHKNEFVLGLLGDMMQRIYNDGKDGLGNDLPADWATPGKLMNHRCPKRIVKLINKVRSVTDKQEQQPRSDSIEGCVRFFILPSDIINKPEAEQAISLYMANATYDEKWQEPNFCKSLTLEHHMAASRLGFIELFAPLYDVKSWRTSLMNGSLPCVRFFSENILPLVKASLGDDRFAIARIVRKLSPLLSSDALRKSEDQQAQLQLASAALDHLMSLFKNGADPSLGDVLCSVKDSALFSIPESLMINYKMASRKDQVVGENDRQIERTVAIDKFLLAPFSQIELFASYVSGKAHFDTHQGVKGLQFERVMVIMDDEEAKGFMFKYENLFGGKGVGDPAIESVRRLFYVTCSRARQSLALVAYTKSPERVRQFVIDEGWFNTGEVVMEISAYTD